MEARMAVEKKDSHKEAQKETTRETVSKVAVQDISERQKALELALSHIEKQFGKGSIMKLGQKVKVDVEVIPTGSLTLDYALGTGGLPRGRVIEIFGPEASGKTTLTLTSIREMQKKEVSQHLLTQNTPLTLHMPKKSVSTSMNSLYPSRIQENRRLR